MKIDIVPKPRPPNFLGHFADLCIDAQGMAPDRVGHEIEDIKAFVFFQCLSIDHRAFNDKGRAANNWIALSRNTFAKLLVVGGANYFTLMSTHILIFEIDIPTSVINNAVIVSSVDQVLPI